MIKLVFCLAFISMVFGKAYPEFESFESLSAAGREYVISKDKLSCGQARAACNFHGWSLAREQRPEDTKALNEAIRKSKRTDKDFWIGGYLYENENDPEWVWLDVGDVVEYTNWWQGKEPKHDSKRCMIKTTEGDVSGKWRSAECAEKRVYICRKS